MPSASEINLSDTLKELRKTFKSKNIDGAVLLICGYADTMRQRKEPVIPELSAGVATREGFLMKVLLMRSYKLCYKLCNASIKELKEGLLEKDSPKEMLREAIQETLFHYLQIYAMIFTVTGYVPHGKHIQPLRDIFLEYFKNHKRIRRQDERELIRKFIELSLEAFDKLTFYRVLSERFPEFFTIEHKARGLSVAYQLGDEVIIKEILDHYMLPPKGYDLDEELDDERIG